MGGVNRKIGIFDRVSTNDNTVIDWAVREGDSRVLPPRKSRDQSRVER